MPSGTHSMQLTPPISTGVAVTPSATGCAAELVSMRSRSSCRFAGGGGTGRSVIIAWNAVYSSLAMPGTLERVGSARIRPRPVDGGRRIRLRRLAGVVQPAPVQLGVAAAQGHQLG